MATVNLDSNFTRKLMDGFVPEFQSARVLTQNIDSQKFAGAFSGLTGDKIDVRRRTDFKTARTPTGDLTSVAANDIIVGKATATVQDYFTEWVEFGEAQQALEMGNLQELLQPMAQRMVTDVELDVGEFMMKNAGLLSGTVGTSVTSWTDIANYGATLRSTGVPMEKKWNVAVNPFTQVVLSDIQRSLSSGGSAGGLISEAHKNAIIADNFAGMKVMTSDSLFSFTTDSTADRVGAITASNPDVTYLTAKDTMTQVIQVSGFGSGLEVFAGDKLQITGRNRLNLSTRKPVIDAAGSNIVFTGTVVSDVTLTGGAGLITITGPALFETDGQYNTVDSAPIIGDVVTLLAAVNTILQPNLFWHRDAFTMTSVPIKRLNSTDTHFTTKDGMQFRISEGSDFIKNEQMIRIDFRPAYGVMDPFWAGHGYA